MNHTLHHAMKEEVELVEKGEMNKATALPVSKKPLTLTAYGHMRKDSFIAARCCRLLPPLPHRHHHH